MKKINIKRNRKRIVVAFLTVAVFAGLGILCANTIMTKNQLISEQGSQISELESKTTEQEQEILRLNERVDELESIDSIDDTSDSYGTPTVILPTQPSSNIPGLYSVCPFPKFPSSSIGTPEFEKDNELFNQKLKEQQDCKTEYEKKYN